MVRDILHRLVPDLSVWAFGSRVTGKARRYSDLDLVGGHGGPPPAASLPARPVKKPSKRAICLFGSMSWTGPTPMRGFGRSSGPTASRFNKPTVVLQFCCCRVEETLKNAPWAEVSHEICPQRHLPPTPTEWSSNASGFVLSYLLPVKDHHYQDHAFFYHRFAFIGVHSQQKIRSPEPRCPALSGAARAGTYAVRFG